MKTVNLPDYHSVFNPETGFFARWGETMDEDPVMSPIGPEIADIEITTICNGPDGVVCKFCYKSNNPKGRNMSLETFKKVFSNLPRSLTQIALGSDATLLANPDTWNIMQHCRDNDVVPNITVANVDVITSYKLASLCGAVAVSRYDNKDWCYDSVQRLTSVGMNQVNIHQLLSEETFDEVVETIHDIKTDVRLKDLNAIVFLSLKQKGRGTKYSRLSQDKFDYIIGLSKALGIPFGFDSCSANKFLVSIKDDKKFKELSMATEPCESTCFSLYVNVDGEYFPCSFTEGGTWDNAGDWEHGIDMTKNINFMGDLWQHEKTKKFRNALLTNLDGCGTRSCPLYKI